MDIPALTFSVMSTPSMMSEGVAGNSSRYCTRTGWGLDMGVLLGLVGWDGLEG
jgi:hypothetical protein